MAWMDIKALGSHPLQNNPSPKRVLIPLSRALHLAPSLLRSLSSTEALCRSIGTVNKRCSSWPVIVHVNGQIWVVAVAGLRVQTVSHTSKLSKHLRLKHILLAFKEQQSQTLITLSERRSRHDTQQNHRKTHNTQDISDKVMWSDTRFMCGS